MPSFSARGMVRLECARCGSGPRHGGASSRSASVTRIGTGEPRCASSRSLVFGTRTDTGPMWIGFCGRTR